MSTSAAWETASAVIVSVGGGGLIVASLSAWLGKVWAKRLMAAETARHARDLEALRATLEDRNNRSSHLFKEKIALYKEAGGPLIDLMTEMQSTGRVSRETQISFEKSRLSSTALLAMFAPAEVFNSYNGIVDYMFDCFEGKDQFQFPVFRQKALRMLSQMRQDVGLYADEVTYRGTR